MAYAIFSGFISITILYSDTTIVATLIISNTEYLPAKKASIRKTIIAVKKPSVIILPSRFFLYCTPKNWNCQEKFFITFINKYYLLICKGNTIVI